MSKYNNALTEDQRSLMESFLKINESDDDSLGLMIDAYYELFGSELISFTDMMMLSLLHENLEQQKEIKELLKKI